MIRPVKTRSQLAAEYGVSVRTLHRWIDKYNIPVPAYDQLLPAHQDLIHDALGKSATPTPEDIQSIQ